MVSTTEIEDIYPLTTTQRGMLFHSLYAPQSGVYFQQEGFFLRGELDLAIFVRAWEQVLARHPILRTAVVWEGLDEPMQVVLRQVRLPLEQYDWRALPADEQQARLERFLEADRVRGFDMAAAPLMRLALIRLADDAYQFIWGRHHLILDGWSTALVMKEVFLSYTALRRGQAPNLGRPRPYRDYLAWLQRQDVVAAEAFWRATLAGFRAPTPLGVDHESHTPAGQEQYVDQWSFIPAEMNAALQAMARAHHLTVNTLFQAAWALMLSRYSGEADVLFGATGSGRPPAIPGIESMAGLFINTLPVRVRVAPGEGLVPWLRQILAQQAAARRYDYSSLVDIQSWSELPRGTPLFDSLLVFENFPVALSKDELPANLEIRSVQSFECTNYPLNLAVLPGDGLELRTIYDADRFDAATITRLQGHLHTLLEGMLEDPARRLADLPFLTAAEREQLLYEWNNLGVSGQGSGVSSAATDVCLHELFEAQAARTPDADALIFEQRRMSYAELNERANRLAHYLRGLGVGPETRVGVCVERSVDLVVGLLGVLKAGGAFVPLDPTDPAERLAFTLADSQAQLVITTKDEPRTTNDEAPAFVLRLSSFVNLRADWPAISREPATNLPAASGPGSLAAVVYTAGRGVLIEQRALLERLALLQRSFGLTEADAVLHSASLAQAAAIWEICWPLASGARLIVALPGGQEDPDYLRQLVIEQAVSVVHLAPGALVAALDYWSREPAPPARSLRAVLYGGEPLPAALAERTVEMFGCGLYQLYESPEAPAQAVSWDQPAGASDVPSPPAGYVLDAALRLAPIDVVGDLYLADPGLARGYHDRPELTAERFIPHPFEEDEGRKTKDESDPSSFVVRPSSRLYRTGDRARRRSDGSIKLVRSAGRQAWIGGVRVELDEVEAALLDDPAVEDCAVLVREAPESGPELVAYIVAGGAFAPERVRAQLGARLPAALRPAAYIPLAHMPLTPNGQVDERALADLPLIDATLAQRWEEQLGALPQVAQAAAVIQEWSEQTPALHLDDLLPDRRAAAAGSDDAPAAPPSSQPIGGLAGPAALADGGPLDAPAGAPRTLSEALIHTATHYGEHAIIHIQTDGSAVVQSYAALLDEARRVLAGLTALGLKPGDTAILQFERLSEHLPAFWGCILGGILPVTVAVAPAYTAANSVVNKLYNAWELLGHPPILASDELIEPLSGLKAFLPMPDLAIRTIGELRAYPPAEQIHPAAPDDLAFLQLTSGSTGVPRCIQERHSSVIAYAHASRQVNHLTPDDVALNWLPIDHVGALLMFHIRDLYLGCSQVQARTDMILAEPLAWLDLIERYRVTHTWSPNFGYKLVGDALAKAPGRTWDLSSVKEFLNGGEQVTLPVLREFLAAVAGFNLAPHAMQPAYGMAETCTAMTHVREFSLERSVGYFDKSSLYGQLRRTTGDDPAAVMFIEVGPPNPGVRIRIADRENRVLPEGVIGRLQVQGAIITPGYFNNPEANQEAFTDDGWFYTGDLAFILDGRLTITGREKEVIIINGANYYCYEIEDVVKRIDGVEPTYVGVCDVSDPNTGTEGLAIFFTPTVAAPDERLAVIKTIRARVIASFGLNPLAIVPVPKDEFPKTTSGKIQRTQLKSALAAGQFRAIVKEIDVQLANANTLPDWFYRKVWRRRAVRAGAAGAPIGQALVFLDESGLGAALLGELSAPGRPCIAVERGAEFARLGRERYRIAPGDAGHERALLESLARDGVRLDHILHLWTYGPASDEPTGAALDRALDEGVYSVLHLVQALAQTHGDARPLRLDVVSSGAQPIAPGDQLACERAALLGLVKTIPHELPWLSSRHVDLPVAPAAENAARLLREVRERRKDREIAYRDGRRLVARLEPVDLRREPVRAAPFKLGGMYLLSGGLGGVGAVVARELRQRYQARLLLIGRTALDEQSGDGAAERLRCWNELAQLGDGVLYAAVDVCDADGLRRAVEQARARWGCELDGVLHLAGTYRDELLTVATRASFDATLRPKLAGAWALHQLVKERPGSLFISFSSVHSAFGGFNVGAYAAANSFLDAFAHEQRTGGLDSFSFAWSLWEGLGISRDFAMTDRLLARGYSAMSAQQGVYSLLAALHHDQPALLIGLDRARPPIRRIAEVGPARAQILRAYYTAADGPPAHEQLRELAAADRYGTPSNCDFVQLPELPRAADGAIDRRALAALADARPVEASAYVAPQTELERTIAAIWQSTLRMDKVGVYDNFFDLGGQSLLMTQVQGKLCAALGRDISMVDMFKYPTISALAGFLSREQPPVAAPRALDRTAKQKEAISRHRQQAKNRKFDS